MHPDESGAAASADDELATSSSRDEEYDVERIHRAITREPGDPEEGREPVPVWLWLVAAMALLWGGWYLGRTGGSFDTRTHLAYAATGRDATVTNAAAAANNAAEADPVERGRQVFALQCQSCHQPDGRGQPGVFPPVVGSEWVTGPDETLLRILLDGLEGPVEVAGATFNGRMPAWREVLSDQDIAAVATHIRQWSPNSAGPVALNTVAEIRTATTARAKPWTAAELRAESQKPTPAEPKKDSSKR
jgi:mono/diheme cytochrome c family protein